MKHANRDGRNEGPASYFFNYNTMESVLLACAILVCICGVMFVSEELYLPGNEIPQIIATMFLLSDEIIDIFLADPRDGEKAPENNLGLQKIHSRPVYQP